MGRHGRDLGRTATRVWQSGAMHSTSMRTLPSCCRPTGKPMLEVPVRLCCMTELASCRRPFLGPSLSMPVGILGRAIKGENKVHATCLTAF